MRLLTAALLFTVATPVIAQTNAGNSQPNPDMPFTITPLAAFDNPWALAFLPDRRMLVTEKPGKIWLVGRRGEKTEVTGVPAVEYAGQGGLLYITLSPHYARDHSIYITYAEPGEGGSGLALARATLALGKGKASLENLKVIWRQLPRGKGGQFGGYVAFSPDGNYLYLASGDRMRFTPAQDPNQAIGKILRLTLDGKPAPGNPGEGKVGPQTVSFMDPPRDSEAAKTAPQTQVTLPGPNLAPAEIWSTGHRTPYGLTFDREGHLWELEHGPRGGDELNLIEKGKNYGWPIVSYGQNYNGVPITSPETRPDLQEPALYWNPVIAPGGLTFYYGKLFPKWQGSAFAGGLGTQSLIRISFDGTKASEAERWKIGQRIRDVVAGPDGALWLLEDGKGGRLLRLTPKKG